MRNYIQTGFPYFSALLNVFHVQFLINSIVNPKPNIATPKTLFLLYKGKELISYIQIPNHKIFKNVFKALMKIKCHYHVWGNIGYGSFETILNFGPINAFTG
jgi:hypothetical protein